MPTYQYACTECGHSFEIVQRFSDDSLEHCPVCEGRLRKVFNAVGVVFKGSGFYRTDSRTAPAEAGATADSGKADSGKADSGKDTSSGAKTPATSGSSSSSSSSATKTSGSKDSASTSG